MAVTAEEIADSFQVFDITLEDEEITNQRKWSSSFLKIKILHSIRVLYVSVYQL